MKTNQSIHIILAGIGCASLLVYILACSTAFSPDDRQVLYPSFDPQSGALSIALYDRGTGRSEQIFSGVQQHDGTNIHSAVLRAGWLPDGKHILVAEANGKQELSLFVLPRGAKEPIRHIGNFDWEEPLTALRFPFALSGTNIYLCSEDNLARVDWVTGSGEVLVNSNKIVALPGDDGKTIIGWRELPGNNGGEFGVLDPETLAFRPQSTLTNQVGKGVFPMFRSREHEIIFVSGPETNQELQIVRDGVKQFARPIMRPGCAVVISGTWLDLGPKQDCVFTAYASQAAGQTNVEYGLLEIPLNNKPLRFTPLFLLPSGSDDMIALLAQPSLSHDGRTWAISTAWIAANKKNALRTGDCALFLVQLDRSPKKITKVMIPLPAVIDEGLK